jgi:hypothetical protein
MACSTVGGRYYISARPLTTTLEDHCIGIGIVPRFAHRRRFELLQVRLARVGGQHLVIHTDRAKGPAQTHQRIEVEKFN